MLRDQVVPVCSKCGLPLAALEGSFSIDAAWGRAFCPKCHGQQRLRPVLIPDEVASIRLRLRRVVMCVPGLIQDNELEQLDAALDRITEALRG